jgi:hypothetical protein
VRACSRLDEIIIGTPKELFRQFKRLGIYEWRNVFELAGRDIGQKIMALRFSDTELFTTSIHWNELQIVLNQHDYKSQIMSPLRVAPDVFSQLYILGTQTKQRSLLMSSRTLLFSIRPEHALKIFEGTKKENSEDHAEVK